MKKLFALICAFVLVLSLAACGGTPNAGSSDPADPSETSVVNGIALDGTWPAETIKIGIVNMDVTNAAYKLSASYCDYLETKFNLEFIQSESVDTVEAEFAFIEQCAAAGCKGIIGWRNVGGIATVKLCTSKGLYYWIPEKNDTIISRNLDNEYLIGYLNAGENEDYAKGYSWGKSLIEAGCKRVVYMAGGASFGISIFKNRQEGFYAAIQEAQDAGVEIEVIYQIDAFPGTDGYAPAQSAAIDLKPDGVADSVAIEYWVQPMNAAGLLDGSVKFATNTDITEDNAEFYKMGVIAGGVQSETTLSYIAPAIPLIINLCNGHTELAREADGSPVPASTPAWEIGSYEEMEALLNFYDSGNFFLTAEEMTQFFPEFNENASLESYESFFEGYTIEKALQTAGLK